MIRHDAALRERLRANIAAHQRRTVELEGRRPAAVAIVVVPEASSGVTPGPVAPAAANAASFLLCRRSSRLGSHTGQWALPGGRCDPGETAVEAALRELHEEVGLRVEERDVLGVLDDYGTRSGYVMTPVIVWGGSDVALDPNPQEVASAHCIGLHELQRDDSPRYVTIPESDRPVVQVPIGARMVHAPTGALLLQFRWVALEGRPNERVDHLEQPVFAWR